MEGRFKGAESDGRFLIGAQIPAHLVAELCPEGRHLLERMLTFDAGRRITAAEALRHAYFRDDDVAGSSSSASSSSAASASPPLAMSCSSNDDSGHSADN